MFIELYNLREEYYIIVLRWRKYRKDGRLL